MDELRMVRREERSLIVATEAGMEFRLLVDESVLAELRQLARRDRGVTRVSPREIQSLIRAGKSRAEVAAETGADESDIERYEEPVLAERRYVLETAHAVPVRTRASEEPSERFGTVIAERLAGLGAGAPSWSSWRDEEAGWMIGLDFSAHDIDHRAVWSFEHRKGVLSPISPDAVTLSKQGEIGDRLIPKLRAVEPGGSRERFDSDAFDGEHPADGRDAGHAETGPAPGDPVAETNEDPIAAPAAPASSPSSPALDAEAEFARRRDIDRRAISTPQAELPDLGQTADLLDALRRRRGERDQAHADPAGDEAAAHVTPPGSEAQTSANPQLAGARGGDGPSRTERSPDADEPSDPGARGAAVADGPAVQDPAPRKRRAAIPSWDDILFGTRSEDDPASG